MLDRFTGACPLGSHGFDSVIGSCRFLPRVCFSWSLMSRACVVTPSSWRALCRGLDSKTFHCSFAVINVEPRVLEIVSFMLISHWKEFCSLVCKLQHHDTSLYLVCLKLACVVKWVHSNVSFLFIFVLLISGVWAVAKLSLLLVKKQKNGLYMSTCSLVLCRLRGPGSSPCQACLLWCGHSVEAQTCLRVWPVHITWSHFACPHLGSQ